MRAYIVIATAAGKLAAFTLRVHTTSSVTAMLLPA